MKTIFKDSLMFMIILFIFIFWLSNISFGDFWFILTTPTN